jgi:very-short-patch-repair endonuclease
MRAEDGLPYPEAEVSSEGGRYRLDFAWPALWLAVEVNGYLSHAGGEQFGQDHARRVKLTAAGWTILTFTWHQVVDQPETVTQAVITTYRSLSAGPGANDDQKDQLSGQNC